jgi:hypothetical protein
MNLTKVNFQTSFECLSYPQDDLGTPVNHKIMANLALIFFLIDEAKELVS